MQYPTAPDLSRPTNPNVVAEPKAPEPSQLQSMLRRIPADIHSREQQDARRADDASRALPAVGERQEQVLRLDMRKRELAEVQDQIDRLRARAENIALSARAIEAAIAVIDKGL